MDILGPNGVITKQTPDELAKLWPWREDAARAARRAETIRGVVRVVEALLCVAALFVVVRFVFAYLAKLS